MLSVFICEDNKQQREQIESILKDIILMEAYDMSIALSTHNPNEVIDYLDVASITGLYFLDIDLSADISGIELASQIRKRDPRGFIVFITDHPDMSVDSFRYRIEAMDFIPKSEMIVNHTRINQCMADAIDKYSNTNNTLQKVFTVKTDGRRINFPYEEIIYIETTEKKHRLRIHSTHRMITFYGKMKEVAESLDDRFVHAHRSNIINMEHVVETKLNKGEVMMDNGAVCLISKRGGKTYRNLFK